MEALAAGNQDGVCGAGSLFELGTEIPKQARHPSASWALPERSSECRSSATRSALFGPGSWRRWSLILEGGSSSLQAQEPAVRRRTRSGELDRKEKKKAVIIVYQGEGRGECDLHLTLHVSIS